MTRHRFRIHYLILALLSGCAATADISPVDWQHGAKRAWVLAAYAPDASPAQLPPCLAGLPAADYAARRFVSVRYRHVKLMHDEVAELTPDLQAKAGDRVELWPADCSAGKLSRISKVF